MARPKKVAVVVGQEPSFILITDRYHCKLTFVNEALGSQPGRNDPASNFIRDRAREEHPELNIPPEEVESLPTEISKGTTCFYRGSTGNAAFKSYQILGMLRAAATCLNGIGDVNNLRSKISNAVRITPVTIDTGILSEKLTILERPLRAQTAQGPRVTLARSECLPAGTEIKFDLDVIQLPKFAFPEALLRAILDYAQSMSGIGQWVNSGIYGKFIYELTRR